MLDGFLAEFTAAHWFFIQLHTLAAGTFDFFFDPHVDEGPGRLRAGVATPDTSSKVGDGKQAKGTDNQCPGQQHKVLWPEGNAKYMELTGRQIEIDQLLTVDTDPGHTEVGQHQGPQGPGAQLLEHALNFTDVDFFTFFVERNGVVFSGCHVCGGYFIHESLTSPVSIYEYIISVLSYIRIKKKRHHCAA